MSLLQSLKGVTILTSYRYIITNYEHKNFSVAQSRFSAGSQTDIVAIRSNNTATASRRQGIDRNSIIGTTVGSSVAALLLLIILIFIIRKRLKASKSGLDTVSSSTRARQKSMHFDINVVDEIGRNSLYHAYPELHDTGRVEMLTLPIPPGPGNSVSELRLSSRSVNSHSDKGLNFSEDEVEHMQAGVSQRPKGPSRNLDDRNSSSSRCSQHKNTKPRQRPAIGHIMSISSVSHRKESSLTCQASIYPTQPIAGDLEVSPSEPRAQSQTFSASSTYANIIDYDYYIHGTPANEEKETNF